MSRPARTRGQISVDSAAGDVTMRGMVLNIDDELMKRIEAAAAELNVTPDEFAERALRRALPRPLVEKNGLLVVPASGGRSITSELIRDLEEEEDLWKLASSM